MPSSGDHAPLACGKQYSSFLVVYPLKSNFDISLPLESRKLLSPLDQQDISFFPNEVVQAERIEFALGIDAIKIDVIKRQAPGVFVTTRTCAVSPGL